MLYLQGYITGIPHCLWCSLFLLPFIPRGNPVFDIFGELQSNIFSKQTNKPVIDHVSWLDSLTQSKQCDKERTIKAEHDSSTFLILFLSLLPISQNLSLSSFLLYLPSLPLTLPSSLSSIYEFPLLNVAADGVSS